MPDSPRFEPAEYARAAAAAIGLPLRDQHLPGVALNLSLAARMAQIVEALPLTPADEAAPAFVAANAARDVTSANAARDPASANAARDVTVAKAAPK
ncbi:MAG: DUF4089 domain-containing protein [Acetobacteraceae bacterium]|nr:DUF4089 domain-containing protein [Acetobacteraceae bacterium]